MCDQWVKFLAADPLPSLLSWDDPALGYFAQRDLLDEPVQPIERLWETSAVAQLVKKQRADGSWRYPGKSYDPVHGTNYDLLETYRSLRVLVEMYGFTNRHPALDQAADYIFTCQSEEGDNRGILGNQYMPYYHGAILELLIKAGYGGDARLERGCSGC